MYAKPTNVLNFIPIKLFKNEIKALFDTRASISAITWNAIKKYKL